MARGLGFIVDGPGELDVVFSLLRKQEVNFTLASVPKEVAKRAWVEKALCSIDLCQRLKTVDLDGLWPNHNFGEVFGDECFEMSVRTEDPTRSFTAIRIYYSPRKRVGLVAELLDHNNKIHTFI